MRATDAIIVISYLLAMVGVGVWFMHRNKSADDFFRGGGRLPWWVVSLSIYATLFSSITFLSIPALTYHSDCRYFFKTFGILILVPIVVKYYLPFFRKLNLTSAYEYLEVRFNLGCRLFASAAFILFMIARTAVVAYLPSVAISAVTGADVNLAIVIVTLITIVYCTIGGVEAVVWSDFIQSVILIGSTVVIYVYLVCGTDGGLEGFIAKGLDAGKFRMMDFGWDWTQPVLWVALIGGIVENLASYTSDQCVVQRYMTCRDEAGAVKSITLNGILSFVNCFVFFTLGVALWTFYQSHADRIPHLAKQDQIFPWFIANELPVGLSGLVLAAVAAATMSTLSANLNSAATAVATDFYNRLMLKSKDEGNDKKMLLCGKIVTVVVGVLGGAFALVLANMNIGSVYDHFLKFLGVLTGGLACLFLMGRFMPFVNGRSAFVGLIANYVICLSLDMVPFSSKPHLLLYGFLGMMACLLVATMVSICKQRRRQEKFAVLLLVIFFPFLCRADIRAITPDPWGGDSTCWQMRRHEEKMNLVTNGGAKVVFIGDSITHYWESNGKWPLQKYFLDGDRKMLNLGTSADRTEHVLWRLTEGRELDGYEAKCVFLLIGTNNAGHFPISEEPPADTILGIRKILEVIVAKQPKAIVVLQAIFPRGGDLSDPIRRRNGIVNREVSRFADGQRVFWLDFTEQFLTQDGFLTPEIFPDFLHPNVLGYEIWYSAVKPYIDYALSDGSLQSPGNRYAPFVRRQSFRTSESIAVYPATRIRMGGVASPDWWLTRLLRNRNLIFESKGKIDLVLLGDDSIQGWETYGVDSFAKLQERYRVLNLGYSGDRTENLIWRIENGELDGYDAKCVMLTVGGNNTIQRNDSPAVVAAGIRRVLEIVFLKQSGAKVLLLPILPFGQGLCDDARRNNEVANRIISNLADGKRVTLVDFNVKFSGLARDHVGVEDYRDVWLPAISPHIRRIVGR